MERRFEARKQEILEQAEVKPEVAAGTQNNLYPTSRATLNGELNNMDWWYSVGYRPHLAAGADLSALMLKADQLFVIHATKQKNVMCGMEKPFGV